VNGQTLFKLMTASPRLPKPWEPAYQEAQEFIAWADALPESTSRALVPMIWAMREQLEYRDGGGLNGYLKQHGLSKKGWKAINTLSLEQTAQAYRFFQARGERGWPGRLAVPADTVREAGVEVSVPLLIVLAEAEISLEGIPAPYDEDWKMMVRSLAGEMVDKSLADCAQVSGDAILVRDYLQGGDVDITPATSWPQMVQLANEWIAAQDELVDDHEEAPSQPGLSQAVPTPGGNDVLVDAASGLQVVRLVEFPQYVQESDLMRHCIGRSRNYFNKHENGTGAFYSFRQAGEERPLATLELGQHNGEWRICQVRGPFNQDPGQACRDLADRLREAHQLGGEVRIASYEVIAQAAGREIELERTSSHYF
jgi:hypothetical protein